MYDIMVYEGTLYVPLSEVFASLGECIFELCGALVLVYCHLMYIRRICIWHRWYTHK